MKTLYKSIFIFVIILLSAVSVVFHCGNNDTAVIENYTEAERLPVLKPDYTKIIIPPNIAPLNFLIKEPGIRYYVKIYSKNGRSIEISSSKPSVIIPMKAWKRLLKENRNNELKYEIYVKKINDGWTKYKTVKNTISDYEIDKYLVYRLIRPIYNIWKDINIHQRNLENYKETRVFTNESIGAGCVNCHTFHKNSPEKMLMHIRSAPKPTMILVNNKTVSSIFSQTPFGSASIAYSSWHPNGRYVGFSVNKVHQFFHSSGEEIRDVVDNDSAIGVYDIETNTIITPKSLSDSELLETYPCWSPDGNYLYYCAAPILWSDRNAIPPENYKMVKYSLMRIGFNPESREWGNPETILSSKETGLSIVHPKISPDGRFLLFCMAEYGCFSIYQPSSDLYMMNLKTLEYEHLSINSDKSDSYHCWSSSSRWIVFSSKRMADIFARPFFSYINEDGKASKPILLPQKDPEFYDSYIKTYNVPELITSPIKTTRREFEKAISSPKNIKGVKSITKASPVKVKDSPWKQYR